MGEDGDASNYIPNTEWALVKLHVVRNVRFYSCCAEPYPDITYTVQMRRKPLFYVFNMIMPCFIITLISLLGFYIPSNSGEKVSMGITTLLSMTVFLMLVAENMPPTSDVLPLVGKKATCRNSKFKFLNIRLQNDGHLSTLSWFNISIDTKMSATGDNNV